MKNASTTLKIFVFGGLALLALPIILTKFPISFFDFTETGQIGDTIGGITAPFVGLLGAYLVYQAFKAQIAANEAQRDANNIQIAANKVQAKNNDFAVAFSLIDDIERRLDEPIHRYEYKLADGSVSKASNANLYEIIRLWNGMDGYRKYYLRLIVITVRQIKYLRKYIHTSPNLTIKDQSLLFERASLTFATDLEDPFEALLMTPIMDRPDDEKQFLEFCRKFRDSTLSEITFHAIDIDDFNE